MSGWEGDAELGGFFGVITRAETYLGLVYMLLSMPLGIFYFTLLLTWLLLGLGLSFILVGIPILGLMFLAVRGLAGFERQLANWLLGAAIPEPPSGAHSWEHPWRTFKSCLRDSLTWKGMIFLMLKMPLGIVSFVLSVVLAMCSISLILTPFIYRHAPMRIFDKPVRTPEEALISLVVGLLLGVVTLHITNGLAAMWRRLSSALLTRALAVPAQAPRTGPVVIP